MKRWTVLSRILLLSLCWGSIGTQFPDSTDVNSSTLDSTAVSSQAFNESNATTGIAIVDLSIAINESTSQDQEQLRRSRLAIGLFVISLLALSITLPYLYTYCQSTFLGKKKLKKADGNFLKMATYRQYVSRLGKVHLSFINSEQSTGGPSESLLKYYSAEEGSLNRSSTSYDYVSSKRSSAIDIEASSGSNNSQAKDTNGAKANSTASNSNPSQKAPSRKKKKQKPTKVQSVDSFCSIEEAKN